jgi:hypothetical protein
MCERSVASRNYITFVIGALGRKPTSVLNTIGKSAVHPKAETVGVLDTCHFDPPREMRQLVG